MTHTQSTPAEEAFRKVREALEYYAHPDHFESFVTLAGERRPGVLTEKGDKAREALTLLPSLKPQPAAGESDFEHLKQPIITMLGQAHHVIKGHNDYGLQFGKDKGYEQSRMRGNSEWVLDSIKALFETLGLPTPPEGEQP